MTVFVEFISWNRGSCWLQVAAAFMLRKIRELEPVSPISGHLFRRVEPSSSTKPIDTKLWNVCWILFWLQNIPTSRLPGLKFLQGLCFWFELLPFRLGRLEKPWHQRSSGQFRCQCSQTLEGYDWNLTSSLLQRAPQQKDTKNTTCPSPTGKTWPVMMQQTAGASLAALAFAFALAFALAAACSESESDEICPFLRLSAWGRRQRWVYVGT